MADFGVGDFCEIKTYCRMNDQLGINVLHYEVTTLSAGFEPTASDVAAAFAANLGTALRDCMTQNAEYRGCTAQKIGGGSVSLLGISLVNAGVGSQASDGLPTINCGIFTKR